MSEMHEGDTVLLRAKVARTGGSKGGQPVIMVELQNVGAGGTRLAPFYTLVIATSEVCLPREERNMITADEGQMAG